MLQQRVIHVLCFLLLPVFLVAQPSVLLDSARTKLQQVVAQFQPGQDVVVQSIRFQGNKVTRNYIILRELPFREGSRIPLASLTEQLELGRLNVFNTQLFLEVIPSLVKLSDTEVEVLYTVKERWYIFPIPYFKLVDRNFNQWLVEQNASLERANYGLKFNWENVSGRRDKLSFNYVNGYNRQFSLFYEQPFADKKLEKGFLAGVFYTRTRQISFATDSNLQVFHPVSNGFGDFVRTTFRVETGFTIRKGVMHRHSFRLNYVSEQVSDTVMRIIENNASKGFLPFFKGNASSASFAEFVYGYQYYNVNNIAYPWKGFAFNGYLSQRGLGSAQMNLWQFWGKAGRYVAFSPKWSLSVMGLGNLKLPFNQPQYNLAAMGYGDFFLRGLEYYVVDGVMAGTLKTTIRHELLNVNVPTFVIKNEKYRKIPFKIIAKLYGDLGGVHHPFNTTGFLNNRLLYTYGLGVDVLSYYDFIARFDFSFNQLGEKGLFLHLKKDF